jgi:diguanylate cyclase (GGDEF)-like protein
MSNNDLFDIFLNKRVLVVEDTKSWMAMLKHSLGTIKGLEIHPAFSMQEANSLLKDFEYDVAIVDLCLPDAPSGEIVDVVLKKEIPTWVLTGSNDESTKHGFINKPIVDYVIKNGVFCLEYLNDSLIRFFDNKKRTVMIVDDTLSYQQMFSYLIKRQNLNVLVASNGVEALELINKHGLEIMLVITDYEMPQMDGMQFCLELRKKYTREQISIIAVSSSGKTAVSFLKAGANDFISKPFLNDELICRVNQNIDFVGNINKIKRLVYTDFLTGLYNRRHFFDNGKEFWSRSLNVNGFVSVGMLDIDFFKRVNDTYGHDVGDAVIQYLANSLGKAVTACGGMAYRFGGEEFAVILPLSNTDAYRLLDDLRANIEMSTVSTHDQEVRFTVSAGLFTHLDFSRSIEDSLKLSDECLYSAKKNGRNQVVNFDN